MRQITLSTSLIPAPAPDVIKLRHVVIIQPEMIASKITAEIKKAGILRP